MTNWLQIFYGNLPNFFANGPDKNDAVTEKGDVALVVYVREGWIEGSGDVGRKDAGSGEGAAHGKLAVFAVEGEKFCEDVFKIARAHGGVADGADLFFIDEESDGGGLWRCEIQQCVEGGGGTIAYILAERGAEVVDCGVPMLSMHAPVELASKADLYYTMRAYKAFYEAAL